MENNQRQPKHFIKIIQHLHAIHGNTTTTHTHTRITYEKNHSTDSDQRDALYSKTTNLLHTLNTKKMSHTCTHQIKYKTHTHYHSHYTSEHQKDVCVCVMYVYV